MADPFAGLVKAAGQAAAGQALGQAGKMGQSAGAGVGASKGAGKGSTAASSGPSSGHAAASHAPGIGTGTSASTGGTTVGTSSAGHTPSHASPFGHGPGGSLVSGGGYGYSSEYLPEAFLRDQKLNTIHEGTTGIQALDLLGRKVMAQGGRALTLLGAEMMKTSASARKAGIDQQVLDRLLAQSAVDATTTRMNLAVGDKAITNLIMSNKAFHDANGKFDVNIMRGILAQNNLSEQGFVQIQKHDQLRQALISAAGDNLQLPVKSGQFRAAAAAVVHPQIVLLDRNDLTIGALACPAKFGDLLAKLRIKIG